MNKSYAGMKPRTPNESIMSGRRSVVSINSSKVGLDSEKAQAFMRKKINQIQTAFNNKLSDIKPYVFYEAMNFVKQMNLSVTTLLTKQHHNLVTQLLDFK